MVIAIIGILIALLLPAVQSGAGSGARALRAQNNLKQIGLGHNQYAAIFGRYANATVDSSLELQWTATILPQIGETGLFNNWVKAFGYQSGGVIGRSGGSGSPSSTSTAELKNVYATPMPSYYCPTRRAPVGYPCFIVGPVPQGYPDFGVLVNQETGTLVADRLLAKVDYALNGGATSADPFVYRTWTMPGVSRIGSGPLGYTEWPPTPRVRSKDVTDGLGKTYLVGEKAMYASRYTTGTDAGDWGTLFYDFPFSHACERWWIQVPKRDPYGPFDSNEENVFGPKGGVVNTTFGPIPLNFGSAHPLTWNAVFCDGSVHSLSYSMSLATHQALATALPAIRRTRRNTNRVSGCVHFVLRGENWLCNSIFCAGRWGWGEGRMWVWFWGG